MLGQEDLNSLLLTQVTKFDVGEAERGWNIAKGAIASSLYSVVVLDELNPVLDLGMLDINEVVDSLQNLSLIHI